MISHCARTGRMLIVIILLALLTGCSSLLPITAEPLPTAIIDKSPFTDVPCSAPCWHGLVIGKSSESQVRSTLSALPFLDQSTIQYIPQVDVSGLSPGTISSGRIDLRGLYTPTSTMPKNNHRRQYPRSNRHHVELPNLSRRDHRRFGASRLCWVSVDGRGDYYMPG